MLLEVIIFITLALIAAVSAILVVTRSNPVISALFLILNFGALAGIYLLLNAQFIAVAQVIVYAGAIMVLFLFVIMLLRPENEKKIFSSNPLIKTLAFVIGGVVFIQLIYLIFIVRQRAAYLRDLDLFRLKLFVTISAKMKKNLKSVRMS